MNYVAPYLTANDRCSACDQLAVSAGNDELKVCPHCYAVLWHHDYTEEARRPMRKTEFKLSRRDRWALAALLWFVVCLLLLANCQAPLR